jgi:DNA-binding beta-propeller fold protein YncE
VLKKILNIIIIALAIVSLSDTYLRAGNEINLSFLSRYSTGIFNKSATEIADYDPATKRLFSTNSTNNQIDIINISDPSHPVFISAISLSKYGKNPTSVSIKNQIVAVSVKQVNEREKGRVIFFNTEGKYLNKVTVGYSPDMLKFTPDGKKLLTANEGEPNQDYSFDPEGSVSIIDVTPDISKLKQTKVKTIGFENYNNKKLDSSIRIFGPNATVAMDLEPEYIAISDDSKTAWVTLQENNAIAKIDIEAEKIILLKGLGFKDHSKINNGLDASDKSKAIQIKPWPVLGMYLPDAICAYNINEKTYIVSANEGDWRRFKTFNEVKRINEIDLNPVVFKNRKMLQKKDNLGRLKITTTLGKNKDGSFDQLYSFGARSFSIWDENINQIYDSEDDFEQITAKAYPDNFNSNNDSNTRKVRSDDNGSTPEGVAIGRINNNCYAFIGLERIGGVMIYNISNPVKPVFVQYINTRNFAESPNSPTAGDLSPEGLLFIPDKNSPNGKNLLISSNEISGTIVFFEIITK